MEWHVKNAQEFVKVLAKAKRGDLIFFEEEKQ
jgi:hypothetical protein